MPATISNPRDVYLTVLADMLHVERTLSFEVLPRMLADVAEPSFAGVLAEHLEETKAHVGRVEQAFRAAGAEASASRSRPLAGLVGQHRELSEGAVAPVLADLLHLDAALHTEAYEIASYRVLVALAESVAPDAVAPLRENLAEEEEAESRLLRLLGELARADPAVGGAKR